jgi:hypothetical protein
MSKDTEYIATLIEFTVSEDNERVDLEACLEIADRANATKPECNEAIKSIAKCLGKSNMKIVLNTLQLLETMCKNCNQRFLYELNNKKLIDSMLKLLQRRRDKAKYGTKITKSSNQLKADAEDKALYLLQLWADTFMMHQAEFRNIHDAYRNLRKDSIMFPERDPNQKFMINFQGQVSPVFLAMEGNVTVPSNNQGGPIADSRRSTTTNQYKPKPTEYKHEVQNTLYDENDEDYDYSAYDGIQITGEEVRILEESMGILKEIERNATKPADMKGDIAKEILSDLVHVHKRLKRFITSEKFASPAHKNEAIRLNQVLSACLSSYKTKYYKLKDDQRKIRTEPDEGFRGGRYRADTEDNEPAPKNAQRLATEYDESAYAERIRPSDLTRDKKGEVKKATFTGNNKLAPPSGWKAPTQDLAPNPDLIDLLNTRDSAPVNKPSTTTQKPKKVEESKEDPNKRAITSPDLLNDLLDLNFGGPQQPQNNPNGAKVSSKVHNQPLNTDIGSTSKNDFFDFGNFGSPTPKKPNVLSPGKGIVQPQFMSSTPKKPVVQPQFTTSPPTFTEPNAPVKNLLDDDDDFFNDLASRKK